MDLKLGHYFMLAQEGIYPEDMIIFIVDGPGWRRGLIDWYKSLAISKNKKSPKKIYILNLNEFIVWINSL